MYHVVNAALLVATIGTALAAQLGAGRLIYAMGRDDVISRAVFGYLDATHNTPLYNLILIGAVIIGGGLTLTYQTGAELVNFGAFIAFMGVNAAAIVQYYGRNPKKGLPSFLLNALPPLLGITVCFYIWWSLRWEAKLLGFAWLGAGLVYYLLRTRFLTRIVVMSDPPKDD